MVKEELKKKYSEILSKDEPYKKYRKRAKLFIIPSFLILFASFLPVSQTPISEETEMILILLLSQSPLIPYISIPLHPPLYYTVPLPVEVARYFGLNWLFTWSVSISVGLLLFGIALYFGSKGTSPDITPEEWIFLRAYPVLVSLEDYLENGLIENREKVSKRFSGVLDEIGRREWNREKFSFADGIIGKHMRELKSSLVERIPGAIASGNDKNVKLVYKFMYEFSKYLMNPTLRKLTRLSKLALTLPKGQPKISLSGRLSSWFGKHQFIARILACIMIFSCLFTLNYLSMIFLPQPLLSVVNITLQLTIPLIAALIVIPFTNWRKLFGIKKIVEDEEDTQSH